MVKYNNIFLAFLRRHSTKPDGMRAPSARRIRKMGEEMGNAPRAAARLLDRERDHRAERIPQRTLWGGGSVAAQGVLCRAEGRDGPAEQVGVRAQKLDLDAFCT